VKPPNIKNAIRVSCEILFDKLELVMELTTSSKHHLDKTQIRTKKDNAKYAKV
jgi:hypothetical protein